MNTSAEAADQVVRMSLNGAEAALKITGSGAREVAKLLFKALKDLSKQSKKTKGQIRLSNLVKSGKRLEIYQVADANLKRFCEQAKKYSTNWQITGRELMTPDEVRMLDNRYALLFIRGERPVMDLKYNILKHPNIKLSADGGAEPYDHTRPNYSIGSVEFDKEVLKLEPFELTGEIGDFAILTEEEIEEILNKKTEEKKHEANESQKETHH